MVGLPTSPSFRICWGSVPLIEDDFDRYALYDLDIIPGGVLGREEREHRTRARHDAVDLTGELLTRVGVDLDGDLLSRPDILSWVSL